MDLSKLSDEQLGVALKVIESAKKHGVNPDFVLPMVNVESGFNPNAKSGAGALGPMQLMPETAKELGVDPQNVDQNIDGGMRYLRSLIDNKKLQNNPNYIFAAYNAGPNAKFFQTGDLKDLPDETVSHVVKVMGHYGENVPSMTIEAAEAPAAAEPEAVEPSEPLAAPEKDNSPMEAGTALGAVGAGVGAVKVPVFRMAQRLAQLIPDKKISMADAAEMISRTMPSSGAAPVEAAARRTHGGENWQRSLTGISTPGAQMDKASLDLAKRMQGTVGINGAPGFTGGTITEGGIILNPQDAAAVNVQQQIRAQQAAQNEARLQAALERAGKPDIVQRGAGAVMGSTPVRLGLAGFGAGYNAQDAYNKITSGDTLGGGTAAGAAVASGLSAIPKLFPYAAPAAVGLTTASDVISKLKKDDRQGAAESGLSGLMALFPRLFGPVGAAVYSRGLNAGEDEELARRRQMQPTITP